jgi:hypothetical protein
VSAQYATASTANKNPMETPIFVMQGIDAAVLKSEEETPTIHRKYPQAFD